MIKQQTFSLKLDTPIAQELELECQIQGAKRNRIINDALKMYFAYLDTKRSAIASKSTVPIDEFESIYFSTIIKL